MDVADDGLATLTALAVELSDGGLPCQVLAAEAAVPAQLVVDLDADGATTTVHLCLVPGFEAPRVLQLFAMTDHGVPEDAVSVVARTLHLVNTNLPMGGLELDEAGGAIAFRHLQSVPPGELDPALVVWPLSMMHQGLALFATVLEAACEGAEMGDIRALVDAVMADLLS